MDGCFSGRETRRVRVFVWHCRLLGTKKVLELLGQVRVWRQDLHDEHDRLHAVWTVFNDDTENQMGGRQCLAWGLVYLLAVVGFFSAPDRLGASVSHPTKPPWSLTLEWGFCAAVRASQQTRVEYDKHRSLDMNSLCVISSIISGCRKVLLEHSALVPTQR